jgi:hypothetical protein
MCGGRERDQRQTDRLLERKIERVKKKGRYR